MLNIIVNMFTIPIEIPLCRYLKAKIESNYKLYIMNII